MNAVVVSLDRKAASLLTAFLESKITSKEVRTFLRSVPKGIATQPLCQLRENYVAQKLKISVSALLNNPGFLEFAEKYHIDRYLEIYNVQLVVCNLQIFFPCETLWTPALENTLVISRPSPSIPWIFGPFGMQQGKDFYHWTEPQLFRQEKGHSWGNRYIFEVCANAGDALRFSGDHSWLRLKKPDGAVYSVGLYRPGKAGNSQENLNFPLKIKKGYFMSPDISEFWPEKIYSLEIEITEIAFGVIWNSIIYDKGSEKTRGFQLIGMNCLAWTLSKLNLAGYTLPTQVIAFRALLPVARQRVADRVYAALPAVVQKIVRLHFALHTNFLQLILGSWKRHPTLAIRPHIASIGDFFSTQKALMHPPGYFAHFVLPEIGAWRRTTGSAYGLPPSCKVVDGSKRVL